jgi:hypothetical protein
LLRRLLGVEEEEDDDDDDDDDDTIRYIMNAVTTAAMTENATKTQKSKLYRPRLMLLEINI